GFAMTEPQAFRWIQRTAMDHRMTMREVAERILAETPDPSTAINRPGE
ncbi:MAG: ANTAR domain-containing protein, partial [Dactylosporangium sp.]|nr:ANTAR domain-containing protein [Dactylosporangium sp.]